MKSINSWRASYINRISLILFLSLTLSVANAISQALQGALGVAIVPDTIQTTVLGDLSRSNEASTRRLQNLKFGIHFSVFFLKN